MGANKKQNWTPLSKPEEKKPAGNQQTPVNNNAENLIQKAEIDRLKKLLSEKIKDPKLAKKAAMIISEMLGPNKK